MHLHSASQSGRWRARRHSLSLYMNVGDRRWHSGPASRRGHRHWYVTGTQSPSLALRPWNVLTLLQNRQFLSIQHVDTYLYQCSSGNISVVMVSITTQRFDCNGPMLKLVISSIFILFNSDERDSSYTPFTPRLHASFRRWCFLYMTIRHFFHWCI